MKFLRITYINILVNVTTTNGVFKWLNLIHLTMALEAFVFVSVTPRVSIASVELSVASDLPKVRLPMVFTSASVACTLRSVTQSVASGT